MHRIASNPHGCCAEIERTLHVHSATVVDTHAHHVTHAVSLNDGVSHVHLGGFLHCHQHAASVLGARGGGVSRPDVQVIDPQRAGNDIKKVCVCDEQALVGL